MYPSYISGAPTLAESVHRALHVYGSQPFLLAEDGPADAYKTFAEVHRDAFALLTSLKTIGVKPRDTVAIMLPNEYRWIVTDVACALGDCVVVGLHAAWNIETTEAVLRGSGATVVVCSALHIEKVRGAAKNLRVIVSVTPKSGSSSSDATDTSNRDRDTDWPTDMTFVDFDALVADGVATMKGHVPVPGAFGVDMLSDSTVDEFTDSMAEPYSLMYTSGTTGVPKGVMVSKSKWRDDALGNAFKGCDNPGVVSYMALAHGGDRGMVWQAMFAGARVAFVDGSSTSSFLRGLQRGKPSVLLCMSHLWAELYNDFSNELRRRMETYVERAFPEGDHVQTLKQHPDWDRFFDAAATVTGIKDELLFDWHKRFGGNVAVPVTGGGYTSDKVLQWMFDLFCVKSATGDMEGASRVKNSYGSTEFPGISSNGNIDPGIDLELVPVPEFDQVDESGRVIVASGSRFSPKDKPHPRGEIRVRHKNSKHKAGYWNNIEATAEAYRDGWYYTGDVGLLDMSKRDPETDRGNLQIIDRVKNFVELYVNSDSVWVEPSRLEGDVFSKSSAVEQIALLGDRNMDKLVALVVPSLSFCQSIIGSDTTGMTDEECRAAVARMPSARSAMLAALLHEATARVSVLKPFEIPGSVVLDGEVWTSENQRLTVTGKPARTVLRAAFQEEIEQAYQSMAAASESAAATVPCVSALTAHDLAARDCELDAVRGSTVESLGAPRSVTIEMKGELELTITLAGTHADALERIASQFGPARISKLGFETEWGGYIKQDTDSLPAMEGRVGKDYLHFVFRGACGDDTTELNKLLDGMKATVGSLRSETGRWSDEIDQVASEGSARIEAVKTEHDGRVGSAVRMLQEASTAEQAKEALRSLLSSMSERLAAMCAAHQKEDYLRSLGHAERERCLQQYNECNTMLRIRAPRLGVRIPRMIDLAGWLNNAEDDQLKAGEQASEAASLKQSLGDAKVWCCISGDLIESDVKDVGTPRWHCLERADIDRRVDSHELVNLLLRVKDQFQDDSDIIALVTRALPLETNPCNQESWVLETSHFWHIRNGLELDRTSRLMGDFGPFVINDTPAGFICKALVAYGKRPALGVPNPTVFQVQRRAPRDAAYADGSAENIPASPLAAALGIELVAIDSFLWVTYGDLHRMSTLVARGLRSLVPRGAAVAIAGFNCIEWAVVDIACALAGLISVGVHTTNDLQSALHVLRNSCAQAIVIANDLVNYQLDGKDDGQFWTLRKVLQSPEAAGLPLKHIVIMDDTAAVGTCTAEGDATTNGSGLLGLCNGTLHLESVVTLQQLATTMATGPSDVTLEPADEQPERGREGTFSLLYTSGSTGRPKGVVVTAGAFFNDISSRNYVQPLITVSYIPLSHSSDRMKLWEFLGNGGRVGFAEYAPTNWIGHERDKKSAMLVSLGQGSNQVEGLFSQVSALKPSAMSCPPNIWDGLYSIYLDALASRGYVNKDSAPADVRKEELANIAAMFGPRMKFVVTGGAPTAPEVVQFAKEALPEASFADSYGTTEAGAISSNGIPIVAKKVRVRIVPLSANVTDADYDASGENAPDSVGEVLVSGPNMSSEYHRDAEATVRSFFVQGADIWGRPLTWYRTGDVAKVVGVPAMREIDKGEYVLMPNFRLLGRISSVVVMAGGVVASPDRLEGFYTASRHVQHVYLHGHAKSSALVAVVVPAHNGSPHSTTACTVDAGAASAAAVHHGSDNEWVDRLTHDFARIAEENQLEGHEIPRSIHIERGDWTIENGMMTQTLKKQRVKFERRYSDVLDRLHAPFTLE